MSTTIRIPYHSRADDVRAFIDVLRRPWTGELSTSRGGTIGFTLAPSAQTEFLSFEIEGHGAVRMLLLEAGLGTFTACALNVQFPGESQGCTVVLQGRIAGSRLVGTFVVRVPEARRLMSEGTFVARPEGMAYQAA